MVDVGHVESIIQNTTLNISSILQVVSSSDCVDAVITVRVAMDPPPVVVLDMLLYERHILHEWSSLDTYSQYTKSLLLYCHILMCQFDRYPEEARFHTY